MPSTGPKDTNEITDQIAHEYLRNRDVACPRCQYPLRNATSNTCPECGCVFQLKPFDPDHPDPSQRLIRFAFLLLTLLAFTEVVPRSVSLIQIMQIVRTGFISFGGYFAVSSITGLTVWSALFLYFLLRWIRAIRGKSYSYKSVKVPAIVVLAAYAIPILIDYTRLILS